MKLKFNGILALFLVLISQVTFAQDITVNGVVQDQAGLPIPGANVLVKGTTNGVQTDFDGKFQIQAAQGQMLVFSFLGMKTQERPASANMTIKLADDSVLLEGVVVTAVGIKRERASIGAATTTINSDEITKASQTTLADAIKGKVAGVTISNASTDPGASSGVLIRGFSSLSGSNQPLYVVDGIPINDVSNFSSNLSQGFDFGRGSGDVNPDDIESVTILKGASSTALYGSRAANGVIIITTKKGKAGKMAIDFSTTTMFSEILRTPKYQSTFGQGWDSGHYLIENGSWGPKFDGQPRVWGHVVDNQQLLKPYSFQEDQLENFFTTGTSRVNTLSVSGGTGDSSVRLSYSNTTQDGIFPTDADSFERNTIGLSGTSKVNKITIGGSFNYVNTHGSGVATGQDITVMNNLMQIPNDVPITEFADYNGPFHNISNYYTPYSITNPYFTLNEDGSVYNKDRFYGSMDFTYDINKWSSVTYRFGLDVSADLLRIWKAPVHPLPGSYNDGQTDQNGSYAEYAQTLKQLNHDVLYNLDFDLGSKFKLASTFGWNMNARTVTGSNATVNSQIIPGFYSFNNSTETASVNSNRSLRKLYGLFNSSTISFDDALYLTANLRNDWYSTLPQENQTALYGGANLSWVFTNTFPAIKNVVSYGKLRGGYGETGVDTAPYQILPVFVSGSTDNQGFRTLDYPLNGVNGYEVGNRAGNPDLKPERRKEFEVGIEASFFKSRINVDFGYYDAKIVDQILDLPLAPSSGYTSQRANVGTLRSKGIEALLSVDWVRKANDGFKWTSTINYAKNESILEKLDPRLQQIDLGGLSTTSLIAREGQPIALLLGNVPLRDPEGNIIVDVNGIPVVDPTQEVYGDTQYDYTMGIGNTFSYKGVTLDFTFDIRQGGLMFSRTADITRFTGNSITTTINDREPWIVPGSVVDNGDGTYSPNTTPIDKEHQDDYYSAAANDRANVISKSFVKLREVVLSYDLPSKYLEGTFIHGFTFSLIGRNLLLWTPESNQYIDPETSTFGTDLQSQFGEFSANPSTRSVGFSLKANF